jgi:DNA methylase
MRIAEVAPLCLEQAARAFEQSDWNFTSAKTNGGLHSIHPYPAKFIPQIPGQLLDIFHRFSPGPVLDPFCGSGTTLLECQARGIPSVGIDLNPIATLIASVKLTPPRERIGPIADALAVAAKQEKAELLDIPRLLHWFSPEASQALTNLVFKLRKMAPGATLNALKVALSRIIVVRVSKQDSDTRYAAVGPGSALSGSKWNRQME